ncbi:MAG: stage III sporulation protein AA [Clostridiales bacterium]|nr:stage III sporulation protein AA [Clostridiales bacterium]
MYDKIINEIYILLTNNIINEINVEYEKNKQLFNKITEIRIRNNMPLILKLFNGDIISKYIIKNEDIIYILEKLSNYSIYSVQNELNSGYITVRGGHRVGVCGTVVLENNRINNIKNISSINIRIAREVIGCSDDLFNEIYTEGFKSTLVVSPPNCGKTTLIRDLVRNISNKCKQTITVIDERSEIGAVYNGKIQMNLGIRTDILNKCPKVIGIQNAIRSMGPDVLVLDEIGNREDIKEIKQALTCGVSILATAHGQDIEELKLSQINQLLEMNIFKYIVFLKKDIVPGKIDKIISKY